MAVVSRKSVLSVGSGAVVGPKVAKIEGEKGQRDSSTIYNCFIRGTVQTEKTVGMEKA